MSKIYDHIIVGAGPIGLTVGIELKKEGYDFLIIEKGALVNSLFNFPAEMTYFSTSKLLEIGEVPFISHKDKPTRNESLEYFRRVQELWDVPIHYYEKVESIDKEETLFKVQTSKAHYLSRSITVATGFYDFPRMMNVPGESLPKVRHYYDEAHRYVGQKVVVVGASNSACDVALELKQKGAEVTMLIRSSDIGERVKYWIRPNIINRIKEGSIVAHFNSTVLEITESAVRFNTPEGEQIIQNDFVLAMTGYQPDYDFLNKIGVKIEYDHKRPAYDPETHESNIPGLFLAGVVCGGLKTSTYFIENAKDHASKIMTGLKEYLEIGS